MLVPTDQLAELFPRQGPNASALALEKLASSIGIDLAPPKPAGRSHPATPDANAFKAVAKGLQEFINSVATQLDDETKQPSTEVHDFLDARRSTLREIEMVLLRKETPVWDANPQRWADLPLPNLLGHLQLQRLFVVQALEHSDRKDLTRAQESLEASWRLNESLRTRSDLISMLMCWAVQKGQLGALRQFGVRGDVWKERLLDPEMPRRYLLSLEAEAWSLTQHARGDPSVLFQEDVSRHPRIFSIAQTWMRASMAEYSINMAEVVAALQKVPPCDLTPALAKRIWAPKFSWWNKIGEIAWPDFAHTPHRLLRLRLEMESTDQILRVRADPILVHRLSLEHSILTDSTVCPGQHWRITAEAGGATRVAWDGRFEEWPDNRGTRLPLTFLVKHGSREVDRSRLRKDKPAARGLAARSAD